MLFSGFCISKVIWAEYQGAYLDVKELNSLRLLPSKLSKKNANLAKAEERVEELKGELAKLRYQSQPESRSDIKHRVATIKTPKAQNWFSEQWALYSYMKSRFRCAPDHQGIWTA